MRRQKSQLISDSTSSVLYEGFITLFEVNAQLLTTKNFHKIILIEKKFLYENL